MVERLTPKSDVAVLSPNASMEKLSPARSESTGRRSSLTSKASLAAPSVWISPDWASHPIIENYYGYAPRRRMNSFFEVMCSPTSTVPTTTLAANCAVYDAVDNEVEDGAHGNARRKLGSFSYSYSTEMSDELSPTAAAMHYGALPDTIDEKLPLGAARGRGFAQWNRLRRSMVENGEFVPVPTSEFAHRKPPVGQIDGRKSMTRRGTHRLENPQGGSMELSPTSSGSQPGSPHSPTSGRLQTKLFECLLQIDDRIAVEKELSRKALAMIKKSNASTPNGSGSFMWNLLCGANTSDVTQRDGVYSLFERVAVAVHNRALNQLHRHRRHVNGILQIVASHNPDLELTEKQLDSFETAEAMLANDMRYSVLHKKVEWLGGLIQRRKEALQDAKLKNGCDCFESTRVKNAMMNKLLEAVSWYRLVQTNSRDESASNSVVLAPSSKSSSVQEIDGEHSHSSALGNTSRSLQELQVEKILNVLAGEDFYSDYNELMCQPDWWDIAQAHFENLIFSKGDSRICQWILRLSKEVSSVCHEDLEGVDGQTRHIPKTVSYVGRDRRRTYSDGAKIVRTTHSHAPNSSEWFHDPQPEQILNFMNKLSNRVRREFDIPNDVSKSLDVFVQRTVFPRLGLLCFNQKAIRDCQRKDKLWRKRCLELTSLPMEELSVPVELAKKIRDLLPSRRLRASGPSDGKRSQRVFLIRAIDAFNALSSIVPYDLLEELMHGIVILHHEAALVLGTTQFSVETFFPLLVYVLLHCQLPRIHEQLHLLENFAITYANANGEESYYVYCVHAAVEYICNFSPATKVDARATDSPASSR